MNTLKCKNVNEIQGELTGTKKEIVQFRTEEKYFKQQNRANYEYLKLLV